MAENFKEKVSETLTEPEVLINPRLYIHTPINVYCEDIGITLVRNNNLKLVKFSIFKMGHVKVVVLGQPKKFQNYYDVILLAIMQGSLIVTTDCKYVVTYFCLSAY